MDKFTQEADKILREYGMVIGSSENGENIKLKKRKKSKNAEHEDQEDVESLMDPKTKEQIKAVKLATKLGVSPMSRGLFRSGEKKLAKAVDKVYSNIANKIKGLSQ
jgi:hypothetical protein